MIYLLKYRSSIGNVRLPKGDFPTKPQENPGFITIEFIFHQHFSRKKIRVAQLPPPETNRLGEERQRKNLDEFQRREHLGDDPGKKPQTVWGIFLGEFIQRSCIMMLMMWPHCLGNYQLMI